MSSNKVTAEYCEQQIKLAESRNAVLNEMIYNLQRERSQNDVTIIRLQKQKEELKKQHKVREVADAIHKRRCFNVCDYFSCTWEEPNETRKEYLEKAQELVNLAEKGLINLEFILQNAEKAIPQ